MAVALLRHLTSQIHRLKFMRLLKLAGLEASIAKRKGIFNSNMTSTKGSKLLLAFDFDHSLIDENSDTYICKLAPGGALPDAIKSLYKDDGWTEYMAEIFKFLHLNGCTKDQLLSCLSEISLTEGMKQMLDFTHETGCFDHIIISDANSIFIDHILSNSNMSQVFNKVFTNPAQFLDNGCLVIQPYHFQDWCTLSTKNLCKGHILKSFIRDQQNAGVNYTSVIYVGDGHNDLCPGLQLKKEDILMPRIGFTLNKLLEKMKSKNKPVKMTDLQAGIVPWKTGFDVLAYVQSLNM